MEKRNIMPFFVGFAIFTVAKSSLNSQDLHSIQATLPESVHSATVPAPQKNARRSY